MAPNKHQHYVPRRHLEPFSLDGKGDAINMYNLKLGKAIPMASVGRQCAKDYFYGKDLLIEHWLHHPEGQYGEIVGRASEDINSIRTEDLRSLQRFTILQTLRTFGYIEKLLQTFKDLDASLGSSGVTPSTSEKRRLAIEMSIRHFLKIGEIYRDLEVGILVNETTEDFITSDDPAIHTNRFHFERVRSGTFGFASAGAMLFLPLTPRLAFFSYDENCYEVQGKQGLLIPVSNTADVRSVNELQFLNAHSNVYFSDWSSREQVRLASDRVKGQRTTNWSVLRHFKKDTTGGRNGGESYIEVSEVEREPGAHYITAFGQVHIAPSKWPTIMPFRRDLKVVNTGTGAGYLRPNHPLLKRMGR